LITGKDIMVGIFTLQLAENLKQISANNIFHDAHFHYGAANSPAKIQTKKEVVLNHPNLMYN